MVKGEGGRQGIQNAGREVYVEVGEGGERVAEHSVRRNHIGRYKVRREPVKRTRHIRQKKTEKRDTGKTRR